MDDSNRQRPKRRRSALQPSDENQCAESPNVAAARKLELPPPASNSSLSSNRKRSLFSVPAVNPVTSRRNGGSHGFSVGEESSRSHSSHLFRGEENTALTAETATLLPSSQGTPESTAPSLQSPSKQSKTMKPSLFGAVMSNVQEAVHLSTPSISNRNRFPAASPGGFNLMNFLNSVTSPFQSKLKRGGNNSSPSTPHTARTPSTPRYAASTPRRLREWHQTSLSPLGGVMVVDWALKSKLEFECTPCHSLSVDTASIHREAMRRFLSVTSDATVKSNEEQRDDAVLQWHENLFYWQYPSTLATDNPHVDATARKPQELLPRKKSVALARSSSLPAFGKSSRNSSPIDNASPSEIEWKEAFQSVGDFWLLRWEQLKERPFHSRTDKDKLATQIADSYFYVQGDDHTLLFRYGTAGSQGSGDTVHLSTQIIISSTTLTQREKLRTLGIRLVLLQNCRDNEEFVEKTVSKDPLDKQVDDEPSELDEDLLALRRAQMFGSNAGADVSIQPSSRRTALKPSTTDQHSPILISGLTDCKKFLQIYRDTIGRLCHQNPVGKGATLGRLGRRDFSEVPRLFCRKLGPFLHATLKRLAVQHNNLSAEQKTKDAVADQDFLDTFDVSGIILPCAVRGLISASIHSLEHCSSPENEASNQSGESSSLGKSHLLVQLLHHHREVLRHDKSRRGMPCTLYFNTQMPLWEQLSGEQRHECCHFAETVETAVWDVNRPSDVAYKLDMSKVLDMV